LYSLESYLLVDRLAHASLLGRLDPKSPSRLSDRQILKVIRGTSYDEACDLHRERLEKEPSESGARAPDRSVCQ
jgi:hypothetical protein